MALRRILPQEPLVSSDWQTLAGFLLSILFVLWISREFYIWRFRLRHIPGPFRDSVSCYWTLFSRGYSGQLYLWQRQQSQKYGRVFRTGPNHVITDDPDVLRRLGALRSPYIKAEWYMDITRLARGTDTTLSLSGSPHADKLHRERHALLAPTYAGRDNTSPSLEDVVDTQIQSLISYLDQKIQNANMATCDFSAVAQYFALDIISSVLWSEPFGFLRDDVDVGRYVQTMQDFLPIRAALSSLPIMPWLRPILSRLLPTPRDEAGLGKLMAAAEKALHARSTRLSDADGKHDPAGGGNGDMLSGMMNNMKGIRDRELFHEVIMAIVAGSDNTASALRMAMAFLVVNPPAYRRLCEEISQGVASGKISSPVVRESETRAMPYLQAVVRETLRLYPLPAEFYKQVPPEGDEVAGYHIPGGTWLGANLNSLGRRTDLWGEDADLFRPERWIEAAADETDGQGQRFRNMVNMVDLVFGSGRFQCLGKSLACMEVTKTLAELLRHFDFAAVEPTKPLKVEGYLLWLITGQLLSVTRKRVA